MCALLVLLLPGLSIAEEPARDRYAEPRKRMVSEQIAVRGVRDEAVLEAMRTVPRHEFVPRKYRREAYADWPLPIGHGQTISQPYIVAFMTEQLKLKPGDTVLEIGTGSGYQAAVLAEITDSVFTIEIVQPLAKSANAVLTRLGYDKVRTRHADGYHGWPTEGPWDAIIVTAAADHVPPPLVRQLKPGGRMCIPVGSPFGVQYLLLVEKHKDGDVTSRNLMAVRFVPLTRERNR
jgi:protein-L-isoaspartate(D-aspartate) O-methyltransferase